MDDTWRGKVTCLRSHGQEKAKLHLKHHLWFQRQCFEQRVCTASLNSMGASGSLQLTALCNRCAHHSTTTLNQAKTEKIRPWTSTAKCFLLQLFHLFSVLKFTQDQGKPEENEGTQNEYWGSECKWRKKWTFYTSQKGITSSSQALLWCANGILKTDYYSTNEPQSPSAYAN